MLSENSNYGGEYVGDCFDRTFYRKLLDVFSALAHVMFVTMSFDLCQDVRVKVSDVVRLIFGNYY